jgi:hypothetical protein
MSPFIVPIAGAALLSTAVIAALRLFTGYAPARLPNSVLSRREQAVIEAAGNAFFPPGGPIPISGSEAGVVKYFDGYVRRSSRRQVLLMRLLFTFTELAPLVFGPRHRRFTRLSRPEQLEHLRTAFTSRVYLRRVSFVSLRAIMTMAYLANEDVARSMRMIPDRDPFAAPRPPVIA